MVLGLSWSMFTKGWWMSVSATIFYIMGIFLMLRAKLFEYESPSHDSLIYTNFCLVDQFFMVRYYIYFVSKQDSFELFQTFDDQEKFLL